MSLVVKERGCFLPIGTPVFTLGEAKQHVPFDRYKKWEVKYGNKRYYYGMSNLGSWFPVHKSFVGEK